jgi:hypothetical protein
VSVPSLKPSITTSFQLPEVVTGQKATLAVLPEGKHVESRLLFHLLGKIVLLPDLRQVVNLKDGSVKRVMGRVRNAWREGVHTMPFWLAVSHLWWQNPAERGLFNPFSNLVEQNVLREA